MSGSSRDRAAERKVRWIVRLGVLLIRALGSTWRMRTINAEPLRALRADGRPVVLVLWHGEMLLPLWQHRDEGVAILVSEHRDGEIIARIVEALGCRTVRGSTSRGAARALIALTRELEAGHDIAITPDGPRGPAGSFAPGTVVAAYRAGAHVVAMGVHVARAWRLRSWDRFVIPKPFTRVTIAYSDPTPVEAADAREAAEQAPRFQALMQEVAARAAAGA